jgi:hypothetical protein
MAGLEAEDPALIAPVNAWPGAKPAMAVMKASAPRPVNIDGICWAAAGDKGT